MLPSMLRTRDTDVKGRVTTFLQPFADPKPSIEITSATVASHIAAGNEYSKQFNDSEMDWSCEGRKRVEGMEPDNRLPLTSRFNNPEEDKEEAFEVFEAENRRSR
jgi:hypothetical protein